MIDLQLEHIFVRKVDVRAVLPGEQLLLRPFPVVHVGVLRRVLRHIDAGKALFLQLK